MKQLQYGEFAISAPSMVTPTQSTKNTICAGRHGTFLLPPGYCRPVFGSTRNATEFPSIFPGPHTVTFVQHVATSRCPPDVLSAVEAAFCGKASAAQ